MHNSKPTPPNYGANGATPTRGPAPASPYHHGPMPSGPSPSHPSPNMLPHMPYHPSYMQMRSGPPPLRPQQSPTMRGPPLPPPMTAAMRTPIPPPIATSRPPEKKKE